MKFSVLWLWIMYPFWALGQYPLQILVKDSFSKDPVDGARVTVLGQTTLTNEQGRVVFQHLPKGSYTVTVHALNYDEVLKNVDLPLLDSFPLLILMVPENETQEVLVTTTRTNSRLEDLPVKVEVLGEEEMNEESTLVPSNVASILGDLAIITVQRTNPVNGNDAIRMQGLESRYTQLMRDGFPLYSGFSGSLGALSIPPLDLKQIEIIKGSASTLYGGGAIGGLINFISKEPGKTPETTITLNATSLLEQNVDAFCSAQHHKVGATLMVGATLKSPRDVNGDGYTDVVANRNFMIHPRVFVEFNTKSRLIGGITAQYDQRRGGDMWAVNHDASLEHPYLQTEQTGRYGFDLSYQYKHNNHLTCVLKSTSGMFTRSLNIRGVAFQGTQWSSYHELNMNNTWRKHQTVGGINLITEDFHKQPDSSMFTNTSLRTLGVFIQDDWKFNPLISLQMGLRIDHYTQYGLFPLPRVALFLKPSPSWTIRMAAGTGIKIPNLFDFVPPGERTMQFSKKVQAEQAYGLNCDLAYKTTLWNSIRIQLDEALYYSNINNPLGWNGQFIENSVYAQQSLGTDTYLRMFYQWLEVYLGYNHTDAYQLLPTDKRYAPFHPRDKFSMTAAIDIEEEWRGGVEASYTSNQYGYQNTPLHPIWFMAAMVERKMKHGSWVLNCENLLNSRQSNYEALVTGSFTNPVFRPIWAPTEGRVLNLCYKHKFGKKAT